MTLVGFNRFYSPSNFKNARFEAVKSIYGVIDLHLAIDQLNPEYSLLRLTLFARVLKTF
jgi:hypothetical protein